MSSSSNSKITHFIKDIKHLCIPFQDIKDATKNFTTLIGKGGYGPVYKGELLLSNKLTSVAIKRLDRNISGQGSKQFLNEINLLSRYKHPNLVSLLGFCEEDDERILIYDYAELGSLEKYLTKGKSTAQLTWLQRINICIDAARGLDYLHNHVALDHRVIHRDIKSANILLSHDWKAMIADFGLSLIGRANENVSFVITDASGTHGYCDPAYISTGILTKESDVYSFGVVLFEVLCGRTGFINVNSEQRFLAPLAKRFYEKRRLSEIIDPYLKFEVDSDSLNRFSEIAYQCLLNDRERRPSMGLVLKKLEAEAKILRGPHENLQGYNSQSFKSSAGGLNQANNLPSNAISELEHEFKELLSFCSKPVEPDKIYECFPRSLRPSSGSPDKYPSNSHTDVYNPLVLVSPRLIPVLHDLAQDMVNAGHTQQHLIIYRDARSQPLQVSLHKLGVEKLSKDDIQKMEWEVLELKTGTWIHSMRIAVKLLFAAERNLCEQMFEGIESLKDQCFAEVTQVSIDMLLSFGNAVAESKRSQKLFVLLDMYAVMRELHSEIETCFSGNACKEIREGALGLTKKLAQTAKDTFRYFEEQVEKHATRTAVAHGTVHPLTSYVINYVKFLYDHQSTLEQLFQEFEKGDNSNDQLASVMMRFMETLQTNLEGYSKQYKGPTFLINNIHYMVPVRRYESIPFQEFKSRDDLHAQLASVMMQIMQALQTNLEGISQQYKDPALTNFFLMNNIHHMVQSMRSSVEEDLLWVDWVQQHKRIVQQYAIKYQRITCAKILESLSVSGMGRERPSPSDVKDRLRNFNRQFEELHQRQSQWSVPDSVLREELRLILAQVLVPAYRCFVGRYGGLVEQAKNHQKYIKYTPDDIDRMLGEFFEGETENNSYVDD